MNNNSSNINVNINFKANTEAAKNNINSLQSLLTQITQTKNIGLDSNALGQAKASAQELQMHLENAVNVNTGKLDLGKFNASLKAAGSDLKTLSANLRNVGPVGQQAFMKLASAIASAQTPMLNISNAIAQFGKTLVNTVKWQLASNLIHGVQGALQAAVSHAKDLNSALNDIRIVTGYSIDKMAEFTNAARTAAKELNTTTTEYAKASLIFFQQGLAGDAVKERTDVVIKMSQVTHESAEQISSELTAIWNNFYDGTHTLEWYADAITELGAATASSSKEIAEGLQKFAAVAGTVGLSYEYATAALATVVAETRQSADIVGTSFKTIFSRLESLKLGETLEDGTDLNKYSAALLTVGVNIKKANGDLKDMDEILDELGYKWQLLGRDQQVALAQTVGGVRQYQQFIALADNWSKVQKNIEIARKSDGTLEKQQKIWSESFEAATKRVEEAKKQLYEDLVNDNALIKLNDIFANILHGVGNVIKSAGGIIPIILMITATLSKTLWPLLANGFTRIKHNISVLSGHATQEIMATQNSMKTMLEEMIQNSGMSQYGKMQSQLATDLIAAKQRLATESKNLTEAERTQAEMEMALYEMQVTELSTSLERLNADEKQISQLSQQAKATRLVAEAEAEYQRTLQARIEAGMEGKQGTNGFETRKINTSYLNTDVEQLTKYIEAAQKRADELQRSIEAVNGVEASSWKAKIRNVREYIDELTRAKTIREQEANIKGISRAKEKGLNSNDNAEGMIYNSMRNKVKQDTGATESSYDNTLVFKANEETLTKLATISGEYKAVCDSLTQVQKDLKTAIEERIKSEENLAEVSLKLRNNDGSLTEEGQRLESGMQAITKAESNLVKIEAQYGKGSKEAVKARQQLIKAESQLEKIVKKSSKAGQDYAEAWERSRKTANQFAKAQQQSIRAIQSLGKAANLSDDQIKNITDALSKLGSTGKAQTAELSKIFTPLISGANLAEAECNTMLDSLIEKLGKTAGTELLTKLIEDAKQAGYDTTILKNKLDELRKNPPIPSKTELVTQGLTTVASGAGKVAMAYTSIKSAMNAITDEDISPMEALSTVFMSLSMIMPTVIGLFGFMSKTVSAFNIIKQANNALTEKGLHLSAKERVAKLKEIVVDKLKTASTAGETAAVGALTFAKVLLDAVQKMGIAGVAVGLALGAAVIAGIITAIAVTKKQTQAEKEKAEAIQKSNAAMGETAKKTEEAVNAWREQRQEMDNLIGAYKILKIESGDYAEIVDKIISTTPDLIEHYREVGKTLGLNSIEAQKYYGLITQLDQARALGDVGRIESISEELDQYVIKYGGRQAAQGLIGQNNTIAMATADQHYGSRTDAHSNKTTYGTDENGNLGATSMQLTFGSHNTKLGLPFVSAAFDDGIELTGNSEEENEEVAALIAEYANKVQGVTASTYSDEQNVGQVFYTAGTAGILSGETQGATVSVNLTNPYTLYNYYTQMQKAYQDLVDQGKGSTQGAKALKKFLESNEEDFKKLEEQINENDKFQLDYIAMGLGDTTDIHTLDDYLKYQDEFIKQARELAELHGQNADEAEANARAWLKNKTYLTGFYDTSLKLDSLEQRYGKQVAKNAQAYFNSLSKEDQALFLKIDFNHAATKEAWDAQMNMLRAQAEQEDLRVKITGITTAQEKLKESGMTSADWQDIQTNVDWEAAGMSFTDFMQLSYNKQKAFLEQTKKDYEDTYNGSVAKTLETAEEDLATLEQQATDSRDAATNYAKEIARQEAMLNDPNVDATTKTWINQNLTKEKSILATMEEKANAAEELYKTQKEYVESKQAEAAIQARIAEDEARSAVMQAESLDEMYTALAHLQTVTGGTLDKNIEWDALANLGSKYDNATQESESFKRIQAALGKAQKMSTIDFADTEEGAAALSTKNQTEATYGYMQRSHAHGIYEWSEEDMQQARQARDDAQQAYTDAKTSYERAQEALSAGGIEKLEAAMREQEDILKSAILIGESADKYDLDPEAVEAQVRTIRALNKEMGLSAEQAARMAIANQRMNKGINTLSDSLDDWKETLKTAKKGDVDWAKTIGEVEAAVKDLIGATDDFELPDDFLDAPENMKLLEKAADGDSHAINQLGNELAAASIKAMEFDITMADQFKKLTGNELTIENFEAVKNSVLEGITTIHDHLKELENGATLDEIMNGQAANWIQSLNDMAMATSMSVEQMNSMLNQLGVQAHVEVKDVPQRVMTPTYTEVTEEVSNPASVRLDPETGESIRIPSIKHYTIQGESVPVDGYVQVAQISTADNPLTPQINESKVSFTGVGGGKIGGGVGRSNTTSGKKDKSKSGSKKEKKDKKSAEKETARYHEITALIEDYTRELDKAGKAKDRAFGPKKLKAMQAEIAAQAQLNAATEEHIREIREWLEIDKARIAAQGATFDEYGNISNYTDLMQQHIDAYNAAVAAYNASGQSDSDKEAMEAADKAYQDFMDQLSQYEETNNLLQEKLDELIEAQQAKYDKEFEMLQYTIEFKIEADDSILSYLDYMKNKIENFNDGVHDAVEMLATLNDEASTLMNKSSIYNRAIDDTLSHYLSNKGMEESDIQALIDRFKSNNMSESDMSMLEDMTEAEYQYLLELKDNLLEINNSLIENMSAVLETIRNSFSKIAEDLDKATRPIERAASALENYVAIIDIIGRDALDVTDAIATELDNAAIAVAHSATMAAKAKVDTLQNERDEVQRLYDEAMAQGLTEMAYKWKIVLEEMDEEIAAATDDFNSKWQEELTKAREAFENTVERIKQSMLDAFSGFIGSWSVLKDSLEYAKTAADRFVPQYKEIYELSKLNRDIMKSIDNTSNIKNKQALRDLQKEINELEQHSGEISQYDLDNARRRYELELARLQLEEARDAKSTVRLSKDSEGNWSYVYTANQDEVEKAEQNYEDKLYAMQQANSEYINSLSDQILALEEQYAEKLAEIRLDNTMSEEERNAAIERLNAYFAEQMEYLTNEGQKAVDNNARLFEEEWTTYHNWTDAFGNDVQARINNQHDFMTQFGDTILGTYTGYGNFDELNAAMVQIAEEASVKMEEAYGALQAQVATAMEAAGIDVAHFGEVVHDTVNDQIVPSAQAAEDAVVEMGKAAVDEFNNLADGVSTWQIRYTTEMQKIIQKNEQLAASVNNLAAVYANLIAQMYAVANAPVPKFSNSAPDQYANTGAGGQSTSGGDPNSNDPKGNERYTDSAHWKSDHHYHWRVRTYESGRTEKIDKGRHKWYLCDPIVIDSHHHSPTTFESAYCAVCGKKISINPWHQYASVDGQEVIIPGYDTGGYTGNWNSSQGKLAILHEKELVLNKEDTKNILGTVELVRKLSQKIDLNAQTARYAFNYHPIINNPKLTDRELQVNQTVSITAEFPNAQNRTEIEEAFTTLINQASQFANQKN